MCLRQLLKRLEHKSQGYGGDFRQVCGVGVLCIGATGGRVGGMGVRVWRAPAGAGGG